MILSIPFSPIFPNTAETAFYGLIEGLRAYRATLVSDAVKHGASHEEIERILSLQPRMEKLMTKDAKLRTFITADADREELVAQVYDTTYGIIKRKDTLVVLDDSIVRGTTLRTSIFADSRPLKDEKRLSWSPRHLKFAIRIAMGLICPRWVILWPSKRRFHWRGSRG